MSLLGDVVIFMDKEKIDILDAFGNPLDISSIELYGVKVEKIFAKDDRIQIQTYHNFSNYCNTLGGA